MIFNHKKISKNFFSVDCSDVCIIGSGPAGISLANELSKQKKIKITLIECGELKFNPIIQKLNQGSCVGFGNYPYKDYSIKDARVRQFGGTSNVWAGWSGPLEEDDFKKKNWIKMSGWPISYNDIKPFYRKSQSILNLSKFIYDKKIYKYYPKIFSSNFIKEFKNIFWQFSDPPVKFNKKYFNYICNKDNIKLFLKTTVIDLINVNQKITEIKCEQNNNIIKFKSKFFILACGAIENASILLNFQKKKSQKNFKNLNIGKFFMEHAHCTIGYGYTKNNKFLSCYSKIKIKKLNNIKFLPGVVISKKIQKKNKIPSCVSVFLVNNFLEIKSAVILRYFFTLKFFNFNLLNFFLLLFKDLKKIFFSCLEIILKNKSKKKFYIISRIEQVPNINSKVYLSKSRNKYQNFIPLLDWQMRGQDLKTLLVNFNQIKLELEKKEIAKIYPSDFIRNVILKKNNIFKKKWSPLLKEEVFGVGHHMGTTRMGINKKSSVVDRNLKVHDLENLYCVGSSVFPTSGYINPTLTIVALSLRLANFLKRKL